MKVLITLLGSLYIILGILYMRLDILWGMLLLVIGAVYFFGLERYGEDESRHVMAHVVVGGMIAGFAGGFLVIEKLIGLLVERPVWRWLDVIFLTISAISVYMALKYKRKFSA